MIQGNISQAREGSHESETSAVSFLTSAMCSNVKSWRIRLIQRHITGFHSEAQLLRYSLAHLLKSVVLKGSCHVTSKMTESSLIISHQRRTGDRYLMFHLIYSLQFYKSQHKVAFRDVIALFWNVKRACNL